MGWKGLNSTFTVVMLVILPIMNLQMCFSTTVEDKLNWYSGALCNGIYLTVSLHKIKEYFHKAMSQVTSVECNTTYIYVPMCRTVWQVIMT
jgi:hypothetical protein